MVLHRCVPVQGGLIASGVDGRIVLVDMVAPKEKLDGRLPFRLVASFKGYQRIWIFGYSIVLYISKEDVVTFVFKDNFATFALGDAYLTADSMKSGGAKVIMVQRKLKIILQKLS